MLSCSLSWLNCLSSSLQATRSLRRGQAAGGSDGASHPQHTISAHESDLCDALPFCALIQSAEPLACQLIHLALGGRLLPKVIHPGTSVSDCLVQNKSVFSILSCSLVACNEPRALFLKCRNACTGWANQAYLISHGAGKWALPTVGYKKTGAGGQISCCRLCLGKMHSNAFRIEMCQQLASLVLNDFIVLLKTLLEDKSHFCSCETPNKKKIFGQYSVPCVSLLTQWSTSLGWSSTALLRKGLSDDHIPFIESSFPSGTGELFFLARCWANSLRLAVLGGGEGVLSVLLFQHSRKMQWLHLLPTHLSAKREEYSLALTISEKFRF